MASGRTTIVTIGLYLSNTGPAISYDGMLVVYERDGKVWLFKRSTGMVCRGHVENGLFAAIE